MKIKITHTKKNANYVCNKIMKMIISTEWTKSKKKNNKIKTHIHTHNLVLPIKIYDKTKENKMNRQKYEKNSH